MQALRTYASVEADEVDVIVDRIFDGSDDWLPEDDVAVIDHLLVVAGRSIEQLPGDVAR